MKNIRILIIAIGDFGKAGQGCALWNWYKLWDLSKLHIDFFCWDKPEDYYISTIRLNGGQCFIKEKSTSRLARKEKEFKQLRNIVVCGKYDYIHINWEDSFLVLIYYLITKKYVKKVILHSHNTNIGFTSSKKLRLVLHKFLKYFLYGDKIVYLACSDEAARWLYPSRITKDSRYMVIKYGIETEKFLYNSKIRYEVREKLKICDKFVIGHVGRLTYQKNHSFLIDIFARVYQKKHSAVLLLIGTGDLENEIKEKVVRLNLQDSVIFYGHSNKTYELYQAMDCFVFPSHFEGLGIVALEAQAAGLRIICSDKVPSAAKITKLLEYMPLKESPEKWAERILSYDNGYERKNMLKEVLESGYDVQESAKMLENLYVELSQGISGG